VAEPTYGAAHDPRVSNRANGAAITAVITGVVALLLSWIPGINLIAFVLGLIAVIAGAIGLRNAGNPGTGGRGQAITGIITGILALVLGVLVYVGIASFIAENPEIQQQIDQIEQEMEQQT